MLSWLIDGGCVDCAFKTYVMDAFGDSETTVMARLVSLAVEAVMAGKIAKGVSAAPDDAALVKLWLGEVEQLAQHLQVVDHLG